MVDLCILCHPLVLIARAYIPAGLLDPHADNVPDVLRFILNSFLPAVEGHRIIMNAIL